MPLAYQYGTEKMRLNKDDFRSLLEHFELIEDFRQAQGRRYTLSNMLARISGAMLSGARGYRTSGFGVMDSLRPTASNPAAAWSRGGT